MQLWNVFYETAQQTCDAIVANTYGDDSHIEVSADQYEQVLARLQQQNQQHVVWG